MEKVGERKGFRSGSERMRFCGGDVDVVVGGGGSGMVEGWLYFVVKMRYRGEGRDSQNELNL